MNLRWVIIVLHFSSSFQKGGFTRKRHFCMIDSFFQERYDVLYLSKTVSSILFICHAIL